MTFWNILKNIFLLLVLLNVAPLLVDNIKSQYRSWFVPTTQVGVLTIKGQILESTPYNKALTSFFEDKNVKAILIKIESQGGSCGSCQALFNEISFLKKEHPKPVIALIENMCIAGGYYIATATDHIVAAGTSIVGGIGIENSCQAHEAVEQATPPAKNTSSLEQDTYQQIVSDIARLRKLSLAATQDWASNKNFTGHQAISMNMIDELGSMHQATAAIRKKALIEGEIDWVNPPIQNKLMSLINGVSTDDDGFINTCAKVLKFMPLI